MKKTERKHWINGLQKRGKNHYCLTISLFGYGLLISSNPTIELFKLI